MTDYEVLYREGADVCGAAPFAEVAAFFEALEPALPLSVLDVGCGQGRDALFAAALGFGVHGIDVAPSGVAQMLRTAKARGLPVTGEVVDVRRFAPQRSWDIVLCDRVLHCLPDADRRAVLAWMQRCVVPGGFLVVVEPPTNVSAVLGSLQATRRFVWQSPRPGVVIAQAVA